MIGVWQDSQTTGDGGNVEEILYRRKLEETHGGRYGGKDAYFWRRTERKMPNFEVTVLQKHFFDDDRSVAG